MTPKDAELADHFRQALAQTAGDDFAAEMERLSLRAILHEMGEVSETTLDVRLVIPGGLIEHAAPVSAVTAVLEGVQRATARLARTLRDRVDAQRVSLKSQLEHELQVLAPTPGSVIFTLLPTPSAGERQELPVTESSTSWAEIALAQIVDTLPETTDHTEVAEDAVALARPGLRDAIADLAKRVHEVQIDVELTLRRPNHEAAIAMLDRAFASELVTYLDEPRVSVQRITVEGNLDGMRSRRRIFYLVLDNGSEISGAVAEDVLPSLKANLGEDVTAVLDVTKTTRQDRADRQAYELVSLGLTRAQRATTLDGASDS